MTAGTRVAIVGASSGLGRTLGLGLAERGAQVALLARRKDRLDSTATEAGSNAFGVRCDVTDASSCRDAIEEAAEGLGGIDALIYATGTMTIAPLETVEADEWANVFATNVTGAALTTAAALPHLKASGGVGLYFSSVSASMYPPWMNLGAYVTSKAALDKLVEAWRAEHPSVRFTRLAVGDCAGGPGDSATEFLNNSDPQLAHDSITDWLNRGYMTGNLIDPPDLVNTIESVISCKSCLPHVTITPTGF